MAKQRYGAICPISHACKVLEPRWTIHILTEMWAGSTRFNEIKRGVGNISPGLLSRRLKELEGLGMIERVEDRATGTVDYFRTAKAIELEPALNALGAWAQKNIAAEIALADVDVSALMWKLRRDIHDDPLPHGRTVMRFHFTDDRLKRDTFWLVFYPGGARDLCVSQPTDEVDLYIESDLMAFGAILTARSTLARETERGRFFATGDARLLKTMAEWLPFSVYAGVEGIGLFEPDDACHASLPAVVGGHA